MSDLTDRERKAIKNRRDKDRKRRTKLKAKLRAEGASEELIARIIERRRWGDLVARVGLEQAREHASSYAHRDDPDDTGYEPSDGDPLLRGAGRVSGMTAKVVRRRHTITDWQYDRALGREQ